MKKGPGSYLNPREVVYIHYNIHDHTGSTECVDLAMALINVFAHVSKDLIGMQTVVILLLGSFSCGSTNVEKEYVIERNKNISFFHNDYQIKQ